MFTIRCTQKLLRRLKCSADPPVPTTALGDWYANILFARPEQLVVCVSERTLLPVVVAARPAASLASRLTNVLGEVLGQLRIPSHLIEQERAEMANFAYSTTRNRRVLGTLNEFVFQLSWYLHAEPTLPLIDASLKLARTPCSAISGFPDRLTAALFSGDATGPGLGAITCALTARSRGLAGSCFQLGKRQWRRAPQLGSVRPHIDASASFVTVVE